MGLRRMTLGVLIFSATACSAADSQPPAPINPHCLPGAQSKTKLVTHYVIPVLQQYDDFICDKMEGTCLYPKGDVNWMHNTGYLDQPLLFERCKYGYGNMQNCLNPCRTIAASMTKQNFGQVIFIKQLVGMKCGDLLRDGFEMIHDGYVVVADTGAIKYFNAPGRFDFFWGRCYDYNGGICAGGAEDISDTVSKGDYCVVWDPLNPTKNARVKSAFQAQVQAEAVNRDDLGAASDFDLDQYTDPDFQKRARESQHSLLIERPGICGAKGCDLEP